MSFRINTNLSAMTALSSLNSTSQQLANITTQLSTGLRINSAADDPSGLIQSMAYKAQIGGMTTAISNNQAAMNYAKTAEGGLNQISSLLQSARALAVANGNASLDTTQKAANQTQLNNILSSIDRISNTTQFGSKNLLNGASGVVASVVNTTKFASASFTGNFNGAAVSSSGNANVQVTTAAAQATTTGTVAYTAGTVVVGAGSFSLNGTTFNTTATESANDLINQLNGASAQTGVTAALTGTHVVLTSSAYGSNAAINLVDGTGVINAAASNTAVTGTDAVASVTIGANTVTFNKGQGLQLKDADGNTINLTAAGNAVATTNNALQVTAGSATFQVGGNAGQTATLSLGKYDSATLGLSGLDITGSSMSTAITSIDSAITKVSGDTGNLGSFMTNTLQANISTLGVAQQNMTATLSNIQDVDVAAAMTQYTKLNILSQSGLSMLTQANSQPSNVLSLIRSG